MNVCNELFPLLNKGARVVHVSSSAGHLLRINGKEPHATELKKQLSDPDLQTSKLVELVNSFVR